MENNITISLCMIVKNEEDFLENCLESVRELVDEQIIVDTGSTDRTVEICKQFGAKIYPMKWEDHFAHARNYGLEKATSDWILWLDADEQIDPKSVTVIKEKIKETKATILSMPVINYTRQTMEDESDEAYIYYQPRLFRNYVGIKFYNRIHETPQLLNPEKMNEVMEYVNVPIHHYGYIQEITERKNKSFRNKQLLQLEYEKRDHSPWIEYHLASEYYREKDFVRAFYYVNQSILRFILEGYKPPSILYKLKYDILWITKSLDNALHGIEKALLLYPDYVDLHFYKGCILFSQKDYEKALACFSKCLQLGDYHPKHLTLKGAGSFRAQAYIEKCHKMLKG